LPQTRCIQTRWLNKTNTTLATSKRGLRCTTTASLWSSLKTSSSL
jgi:hypothetical protein